jgi:hypothetical protein
MITACRLTSFQIDQRDHDRVPSCSGRMLLGIASAVAGCLLPSEVNIEMEMTDERLPMTLSSRQSHHNHDRIINKGSE